MDIRIGGRLGREPASSATSCSRRSRTGTSTRRCCRSSTSTSSNHDDGETFRDFAGRTEPEWWTQALTPAGRRARDRMTVTEVLAQAVERHHPRLVMLCSFQKEESVLVDELVRLAPDARIVTIDTGVLFPETLATWRAFEERFGVDIEIEDATGDWTGPAHCCGERKVAALERALDGVDAWITGIRREQSPDARRRAAGRVRRQARDLEVQPARRVDREGPLAAHPRARPALQPAARPGLRVDRLRARARTPAAAARVAGRACPRRSAGCTSDGSLADPLRLRRRHPRRHDRHGRRQPDDAAADPRLRHQAGGRGRHRPRLRRDHQDRRRLPALPQGHGADEPRVLAGARLLPGRDRRRGPARAARPRRHPAAADRRRAAADRRARPVPRADERRRQRARDRARWRPVTRSPR